MEIMLTVAAFFGVICALIAGNKNRSTVGWFILGALFGIFALIIIACLPKRNDTVRA